ncbi:MAG: DMT family transporter [Elainellaceae cyanobacterium]
MGWKVVAAAPGFLIAVWAGLCAAVLYAIAAPYIKQTLAGIPALVVTTGSQLGAAALLMPVLPFTVPQQTPPANVIAAVAALALLSTAVAYLLYFRLIQNVGSTKALTVTYLVPLFAILWGAVVLGEVVTASMVLGCGSILLGTAIANDVLPLTRRPSA